jgi:L-alanine-DL-glutamate epimerase-like enolase superfamily enzyme
MRIKDVDVIQLFAPLGENSYPVGVREVNGVGSLIIQIYTDEGITGIGEAGELLYVKVPENLKKATPEIVPSNPAFLKFFIEYISKNYLIGENPLNLEKLYWKICVNLYETVNRRVLGDTLIEALSGIEIALWDIRGKSYGRPVCELLGGVIRENVEAYASAGLHKDPELLAEEVKNVRKLGFKGYKMRVHGNILKDLERVKIVRENLDEEYKLMVDVGTALYAWRAEDTIRFSKEIEKLNIFWLEDPVKRFDISGLKKVRESSNIPIAMGEQYYLLEDFKELLAGNLIDYAQPDAVRCGGISECKRIADIANSYSIKYVPHCWESAVAEVANLHIVAASYNGIMIEYPTIYNPLLTDLLKQEIEVKNGFIQVPKSPGLGIELNEKILDRYRV